MRKAEVSESVIMKITGHSTREMFDRYNTVDKDDAKEAIRNFEDFFIKVDPTVEQTPICTKKEVSQISANPL